MADRELERAATILHVDMDAFFASVEVLDDPSLRGRPVIVGGTGNRGVVAACTYEARVFGVRSAMPMFKARQLCPQAIVVPGNFARYQAVSSQVHGVFAEVTDLVEAIGLDEAFLDVAPAIRRLGPPVAIAHGIKDRVAEVTGLSCAVGVGTTKMVAKLASRRAKPTASPSGVIPGPGVVEVAPGEEAAFVAPLPIRALWGIGPQTAAKLAGVGISTVAELAALDESVLVGLLGLAAGRHLSAMAQGADPDPVTASRPVKSISQETTFPVDLVDRAEVDAVLVEQAGRVGAQLRAKGLSAKTISVKVRFGDFSTLSRQSTSRRGLDTGHAIAQVALELAGTIPLRGGVRLLGVGASGLAPAGIEQMAMFVDDGGTESVQDAWAPVTATIDAVKAKFGTTALGLGRELGGGFRDQVAPRPERWGPTAPQEDPRSSQ